MSSDPSPSGQNLSDQDLYNELAFYTLELRDPDFIHQHIVDAWAVQHAETDTKPIAIVFGLIVATLIGTLIYFLQRPGPSLFR